MRRMMPFTCLDSRFFCTIKYIKLTESLFSCSCWLANFLLHDSTYLFLEIELWFSYFKINYILVPRWRFNFAPYVSKQSIIDRHLAVWIRNNSLISCIEYACLVIFLTMLMKSQNSLKIKKEWLALEGPQ